MGLLGYFHCDKCRPPAVGTLHEKYGEHLKMTVYKFGRSSSIFTRNNTGNRDASHNVTLNGKSGRSGKNDRRGYPVWISE